MHRELYTSLYFVYLYSPFLSSDILIFFKKKFRIFKVSKLNGFTVVLQDLLRKMFGFQFFYSGWDSGRRTQWVDLKFVGKLNFSKSWIFVNILASNKSPIFVWGIMWAEITVTIDMSRGKGLLGSYKIKKKHVSLTFKNFLKYKTFSPNFVYFECALFSCKYLPSCADY